MGRSERRIVQPATSQIARFELLDQNVDPRGKRTDQVLAAGSAMSMATEC